MKSTAGEIELVRINSHVTTSASNAMLFALLDAKGKIFVGVPDTAGSKIIAPIL